MATSHDNTVAERLRRWWLSPPRIGPQRLINPFESPSPAIPGSGCIQLHPAAATARRWRSFTLHSVRQRLAAQEHVS